MEIKKIRLIENPRTEFSLSPKDMSLLMGGTTCISFDSCSASRNSACTSFSYAGLCDGSTNTTDVKCSSYSF